MSSPLGVDVEGAVRQITLTRPQRRNALNAELHAALVRALREFDADPGARVAVLTGGLELALGAIS